MVAAMKELEFLEKADSVCARNEKLRYMVEEAGLRMYIRIILRYADGTPVTMVTTQETCTGISGKEEQGIFPMGTE